MMDRAQRSLALAVGGLYALGVLVTAIHLSRFAIFDITLTKVTYILAGAASAFYLLLRFCIAVLIVDFWVVRNTFVSAESVIYAKIKQLIIFKIIDRVASWSVLKFFLGMYTSKRIARMIVSYIAMLVCFLLIVVYSSAYELDGTGLSLMDLLDAPPIAAFLLGTQIAYILWCYLLPVFKTSRLLRAFWGLVLGFLIVADTAFYALTFHPLLRPTFGGGNVYAVELPESVVRELIGFTALRSNMILLHVSSDAYYLTTHYERNYKGGIWDLIEFGDIIRIGLGEVPAIKIQPWKTVSS